MATWFRQHSVGIASILMGAVAGGCAAYAATERRIAVLEEKAQHIEMVKDNVLILCTTLGANCRQR